MNIIQHKYNSLQHLENLPLGTTLNSGHHEKWAGGWAQATCHRSLCDGAHLHLPTHLWTAVWEELKRGAKTHIWVNNINSWGFYTLSGIGQRWRISLQPQTCCSTSLHRQTWAQIHTQSLGAILTGQPLLSPITCVLWCCWTDPQLLFQGRRGWGCSSPGSSSLSSLPWSI